MSKLNLALFICFTPVIAVPATVTAQPSASVDLVRTDLPNAPGFTSAPVNADADYSSSLLDDAQQPTTAAGKAPHEDNQPRRILGIIPNFRAVNVGVHLPPQTVKDKFVTASEDSFDYSSIVLPAVVAVYHYGTDATPEFGKGGVGYGRYLWHDVLDQTSENYFVEFIVPAIAHEDTRYYTLGKGGFLKRTGYSLGHVFITKSDSGKTVFNSGEIIGAGAASGMSNLYYPRPERTFSNTAGQWGTDIGIDAFTFMFKEFWPDINHKLFHGSAQ